MNRKLVNIEMKKLSNKIVQNYIDGKIKARKLDFNLKPPNFFNIIKLSTLRDIVQIPNYYEGAIDVNFKMYKKIFVLALNEVTKWNGKITFVYLPSYNELINYKKSFVKKEYDLVRDKIFPLINQTNTKIIDLTPIFHIKGKATDFFHNPKTHYNQLGYQIVGEQILSEFK